MGAQASEAVKHVDALWFSDHDWREAGIGAPTTVHFNSLTSETLGVNPAWKWTRKNAGPLTPDSNGGIDSERVSARDPDERGCLYARAISGTSARASLAWYADDTSLRNSMCTPAYGQTWSIEVLVDDASDGGYAFVRVALSYHPAAAGRADAYYFLEYRFGPFSERSYAVEQLTTADLGGSDDEGGGSIKLQRGEQILLGVVNVPQDAGGYHTQTMTFTDDIACLFPGMVARDNSIRGLWLGAASAGAPTLAFFDYLTMGRVVGQAQFEDRRAIGAELAPAFPSLQIYHASELSYGGEHRHWLGGDIQLPTYGGTAKARGAPSPTSSQQVATILAGGGLPIANHPFGTNGAKLSDALAKAKTRKYVAGLLQTGGGGGLRGLEVFYRSRAGATLEHHWRLFRLAVANGLVLTASGVSDNHWGRVGSWAVDTNRFTTSIYSADVSETSLLDAQSRGRAYCTEIGSYTGQLDLSLDDDLMGQIGVRTGVVSRTLTVKATQLPAGSAVEIWQIPVTPGDLDSEPGGVIATLPASAFIGDVAGMTVDTGQDCAFAAMVVHGSKRVAGTNPVWHLTDEPTAWTIPDNRRVS